MAEQAEPTESDHPTTALERAFQMAGQALAVLVALLLIAAVPAVVVAAIIFSYPSELPDKGFIDSIFANTTVLWVARVVVLFAGTVIVLGGLYLLISIGSWIRNKQWLTKLGPLEVARAQAVEDIRDEAETWRGLADSAEEEIETLTERLRESDAVIKALYEQVQSQDAEMQHLKRRQHGA